MFISSNLQFLVNKPVHTRFLQHHGVFHHCFLAVLQTGRAIKFAVDHVFSSSERSRQVKNRIAVVVTDGKSQDDVVNVTLRKRLTPPTIP